MLKTVVMQNILAKSVIILWWKERSEEPHFSCNRNLL